MWHRKPVVAGSFYPSNSKKLSEDVDFYLQAVEKKELDGELIGLISPHAGYVYSAPVAAYSFIQLMNMDIDVAIVLAPSHSARFNGASVIVSGKYETPLGAVEIDEKIGKKFLNEPHFTFLKDVHVNEHSLEVQVPFLQKVIQNFKIVPIIIGVIDLVTCSAIAEEISRNLIEEDRKFVIIISTDLSHYNPYDKAREIDGIFIENLEKYDENSLYDVLKRDQAQACGQGPVLTGIIASKNLGAGKIDILKYATSGDTAGDKGQVVGYLAAAVLK